MSMARCKCGVLIDTDDHPESYWLEGPDGKDIELAEPLCESCKEEKFKQLEAQMAGKT